MRSECQTDRQIGQVEEEETGSSGVAIKKYIKANFKVMDNVDIKAALRKGIVNGTLNQVQGNGASDSFKVTKVEKPKKVKKTPKKPAAKKPAAKKATPKKKPAAKKATSKKKAAPKKKTPAKKSGKAKKQIFCSVSNLKWLY